MIRVVYIIPILGSQETGLINSERVRVGNIFDTTRQKLLLNRNTEDGESTMDVMTSINTFAALDDTGNISMRINTSATAPLTIPTQSPGDNSTKAASTAYVDNIAVIKTISKSLTAAELKTGSSVPVDSGIPEPAAGYAIEVVSGSAKYTYNSTVFTSSFIALTTDTATVYQAKTSTILSNAVSSFARMPIVGFSDSQVIAAKKLYITTSADSATGNGTAIVYIAYRLITV